MPLRVLRWMINGDEAEAAVQVVAVLTELEEAFVAAECGGKEEGRRYFGGDGIKFLDITLGLYVGWFHAAELVSGRRSSMRRRHPGWRRGRRGSACTRPSGTSCPTPVGSWSSPRHSGHTLRGCDQGSRGIEPHSSVVGL
jgi:hypothetical protein